MIINFFKSLWIPLFAMLCLAIIAIFIYFLQHNQWPVFNQCLCQWDCGWYANIKSEGYVLHANKESNLAFFPLFPYLWSWLEISVLQMSLLNAGIFCLSFAFLQKHIKFNKQVLLAFFCIGLLPFFMVPYSESIFFAGATLFLLGLNQNNKLLIICGIAISVTARSASMIFGVAFFIMFITNLFQKQKTVERPFYALLAFVATLLFTLLVFYFHYLKTGNFFAFFYAQQFWDHHAGLPQIPLTSWHWPTHMSDPVALIFGLTSAILVIHILFTKWFKIKFKFSPFQINDDLSAAETFSLLYIAGTAGAILAFQGGDLHSLNRYILATPFFIFFIHLFYQKKIQVRFKLMHYLLFAVLAKTFFPAHAYVEHDILVTFAIFIVPAGVYFMNVPVTNIASKAIVQFLPFLLGAIYQIITFSNYFSGNWMG